MALTKMNQLEQLTIGEVVTKHPELVKVLMDFQVDFCCGGDRNIMDAIKRDTKQVDDLVKAADAALEAASAFSIDGGAKVTLSDFTNEQLIDRILMTHHKYLKETMPKLSELMYKVLTVHGEHHPELYVVHKLYGNLKTELEGHMTKEEKRLFPMILAGSKGVDVLIEELENEHVGAGDILHTLTEVTDHFSLPKDACTSYGMVYDMLKTLVADMYMHVHTENNILFKRF